MTETIETMDHGGWVEITLNRPDVLNSFNADMHDALRKALTDARTKRAVLLTGAGRAFCAGQDLSDRDPSKRDSPPDLSQTVRQFWNPLVRQIRALEMPIICAVNGVAAGAGSSLALACDIVLAAQSARFIQSFAKVGLIPDTGGSWQLPRLIGPARARALAITGEPLTADMAADWGLIWKSLPDDALMDEARALTGRLSQGPTLGYASTKCAMDAAAGHTLAEHLKFEAGLMKTCGESADYAEGVAAFLAKRPAEFQGR